MSIFDTGTLTLIWMCRQPHIVDKAIKTEQTTFSVATQVA